MEINSGDTIGIIALSGDCDKEKVEQSKAYFESYGFNVKLSKNIFDQLRYLAGSDEDKVSELHRFFEDDEIKLIMCARGGYGAIRLINKIDYDLIKANPKPFCGFSDVTALLLMIYKKTGIVTYHSPMACTDFLLGATKPETLLGVGYTQRNFFKAIKGKNLQYKGKKLYKSGYTQAILWGGNLSTVVSLCGQDFIPDKDFIFFTEDLNEPVYKIDKMFQQLMNISDFKENCRGILLGDFLGVDNKTWLNEYFEELSNRLDVPILSGLRVTHADEKITLPIGRIAQLNGRFLTIEQD